MAPTIDHRPRPIDAQVSQDPASQSGSMDFRQVSMMPTMTAATAQTLRDTLGSVQKELTRTLDVDQQVVGASAVVSASMSIGYVIWMLRGGALLTSLFASMPAWSSIDPLPVLDSPARRDGRGPGDDEDDSLSALIARGARRLQSMTGTAGASAAVPASPSTPSSPPPGSPT